MSENNGPEAGGQVPAGMKIEEIDPVTAARLARAPMPSAGTLRRRRNLFVQLFKLARFNFRILQIVSKEAFRSRS